MLRRPLTIALLLLAAGSHAAELRLIPQPAEVQLGQGTCPVKVLRLVVADPKDEDNAFAAGLLRETITECGLTAGDQGGVPVEIVTAGGAGQQLLEAADCVPGAELGEEGYRLVVRPDRITLAGRTSAGTFYAVQTLRQLLRANRDGQDRIPTVSISDHPAFPHRGFSDDISRGPFPTVAEIKRIIATAAELKLNCLTWYIEHVFKIPSQPVICPKGIGLSKEMMAELEPFARRYHVELFGGFQSFGHFWNILKHDEYKALRETPGILSPAFEESYQLLADIYDAMAPSFSSPLFNICCDETYGLGEGPSKPMVERDGLGAVYAGHIKRCHDLLAARGKRTMMWGDIVLQHPEQLQNLPKDIVMLSWGYGAAPSFEAAITPFKDSGFEFWVCPGVSCWSRMLPDHTVALVNIQNYLRDGARLGAAGVLNTTWDDDGENLFEVNWYGLAWGAECSWRPVDSDPEAFTKAFGPCFFGSEGAGEAMQAMSPAFRMATFDGLNDRAFWVDLFAQPVESPGRAESVAQRLMACTDEALAKLGDQAAPRNEIARLATAYCLRRISAMGQMRLDRIAAGRAYTRAANGAPADAAAPLAEAKAALQASIDRLSALRGEYQARWLAENEPYWLDEMLKRWDALVGRYEGVLKRLDEVAASAAQGEALPAPEELGLAILADLSRLTPERRGTLAAADAWQVEGAVARLPFELHGAKAARPFYFGELTLPASALAGLVDDPARFRVDIVDTVDGRSVGPGQLWKASDGSFRLAFEQAAPIAPDQTMKLTAYVVPGAEPPAVTVTPATELEGGLWLENDQVKVLMGPEGGHLYRWLVKGANDLDLADSGDTDWHGFLDEGGDGRTAPYRLEVITQGPLLARVRAVYQDEREKVVTLYHGRPAVEVLTSPAYGFFWCYDAAANMAADSKTPGTALFDTGKTEPVPAAAEQVQRQEQAFWSAKYRPDGVTLAMLTPDAKNAHRVGPGGGWGGVGLEAARPESHFVVFGGVLGDDRAAALDDLRAGLARLDQPVAVVGAWERR